MTDLLWKSRERLMDHQLERLNRLLEHVVLANAFWTERLSGWGVERGQPFNWETFRQLPLTSKSDLAADQLQFPPYGRNLSAPLTRYTRLHQTSGTTTGQPLRWLDTPTNWNWILDCWDAIYRLVELMPDDRLCFPFSFGPFLGFWAGFEGAARQGRLVLAAGGMSSEARLRLIADNQATLLGCTPTYALRLAEVAVAQGIDLPRSSIRAVLVAGEPGGCLPSVRARLEAAWGARVFDHWGMTEIGPLATEAADDPACLTVLETECIAEILDPQSGHPVANGELGELVVTNLGRIDSPVIRYRTGDLVRAAADPHPSGRILLRLPGGVLGRVDDMLIIRGNNVFPSSLEAVVREFAEIVEFRIVVSRQREMDHLRLDIEPVPETADPDDLLARVKQKIQERLSFQAEVRTVSPETLPRFEMKARRVVRE